MAMASGEGTPGRQDDARASMPTDAEDYPVITPPVPIACRFADDDRHEYRPWSTRRRPAPVQVRPSARPQKRPYWRGFRSVPWYADVIADFADQKWKRHRAARRHSGPQKLAAEPTDMERDLVAQYKSAHPLDLMLLIALASTTCRTVAFVQDLWDRQQVPAAPTETTEPPPVERDSTRLRRILGDRIVELQELLMSHYSEPDALDGDLPYHSDALLDQALRGCLSDKRIITTMVPAVKAAALRERDILQKRCALLAQGGSKGDDALAALAAPSVRATFDLPPRFIYVRRNLFTDSAPEPDPGSLFGCHCVGECQPLTCQCVLDGIRTYSADGSLNNKGIGLVVECNSTCTCDRGRCRNRVVGRQGSIGKFPLEVRRTTSCGFGLFSAVDIPQGQYVCEYLGQIISESEVTRLQRDVYFPLGLHFIWTDGFHLPSGIEPFSIDSTTHGNVSRFVNHSCDPNMFTCRIEREYRDPRVPQVAFFTKRPIAAGEELTIDYCFDASRKTVQCKCGSRKCRKWLK
ncbi:unnamed protein product (mitochondrion) [Plasmodiophora brassicae]|uniref:SET domain-containing protein n=1 Tax=Plasmodiophora brassicae TaxID=37360 RepID=A0A3P3YLY5_PLABS|nr:unnamed protein product [Plasmodiophora brassicae]